MNQINLIDSFPRILEEVPGFITNLEKYNGWRKAKKPSEMLQHWGDEADINKFYFLGWLKESTKRYGTVGAMAFFSLHQKRAVTGYIESILEEATKAELDSFERGIRESYHK
jgi:hypothetical protein